MHAMHLSLSAQHIIGQWCFRLRNTMVCTRVRAPRGTSFLCLCLPPISLHRQVFSHSVRFFFVFRPDWWCGQTVDYEWKCLPNLCVHRTNWATLTSSTIMVCGKAYSNWLVFLSVYDRNEIDPIFLSFFCFGFDFKLQYAQAHVLSIIGYKHD